MEDDATMDHDLNNDPNANGVDDFCSTIFRNVPKPLLPHPTTPPTRAVNNHTTRVWKTRVATRSSLRLAAHPSSVPVAERAQRKLMRELDFINSQSLVPDAAITAYVDMYAGELLEEAIKALRAATRLSNKKLAKALAAIV
jgi:hypothetical protein